MSLDCWDDGWSDRVNGAKPIAEVGHADASQPYEMDMLHVFRLDTGEYVIVTECGCSCYESSNADLEMQPSFAVAMDKYMSYKKENSLEFSNLEYLEMKSMEKENEPHLTNIDPKAS